ncbi:UDP-N-acetylmuramate--L-alanine ligase [soil metagenome]
MSALDLRALARRGGVHFMGVGGAGMAPLADLLLRDGGRISGCDLRRAPATDALAARGAEVEVGHDPGHVRECAVLIVSSAVDPAHPEVAAARARGIPVLKRAEALGAVVNSGVVVGVAGTHGKTTTTALTVATLAAGGLDPTGIVGGRVPAGDGNLRHGGDRIFVVEADEYDRSFHTLSPSVAVVTTLEADHLDVYGSLGAVEEAFRVFTAAVPADGLVALCADDSGAGRLTPLVAAPVITYGTHAGSQLRAERMCFSAAGSDFAVRERGRLLGDVQLGVPGLHNVQNALGAVAVARHFGVAWEAIAGALAEYEGIDRRFERVGERGGVLLVDDYAHHPTELRATLAAARAAYPERRLVAVFQPHLFTRTRDFAAAFGEALAAADLALVTDVYPAREAPLPGVTGELIATAALRSGGAVEYLAERSALPAEMLARLRPGDLCLTLGAGDLDAAAREVLEMLPAKPGRAA